jgi:hypothetical protein
MKSQSRKTYGKTQQLKGVDRPARTISPRECTLILSCRNRHYRLQVGWQKFVMLQYRTLEQSTCTKAPARPPLAHAEHRAQASHCLPLRARRHHFFDATFFVMAL